MKRVIVSFRSPKDVADQDEDARHLRYPFSVVPEEKIGKSDERKHTTEHQITVSVSDSICEPWRKRGADIDLILFEAGRNDVEKVFRNSDFQKSLKLELGPPEYTGASVPFEGSRIPRPSGLRMVVEDFAHNWFFSIRVVGRPAWRGSSGELEPARFANRPKRGVLLCFARGSMRELQARQF